MATLLTIDTTPLAINPVYSPVTFKVTSTDTTIKAVRGDLYINGTYSSTINGTQVLGTTDEFNFDVAKIMQSDLVSELRTNITTTVVTDAITSAKTIKMRFFEIVETAGVHTSTWLAGGLGTNYLESSNYDVVNMSKQDRETLADWTVDDSTKKLLTLRTDNTRIPRGVPFQIGFLSSDSDFTVSIEKFDINLVSLGTVSSIPLASLTSSKGIIEIAASSFSASNIAYIDVGLLKSPSTARSITYRYKIVDICSKFTIFWQNHLGDFDHFDFGNKVTKQISTVNKTMTKNLTTGNTEDAGIITVFSSTRTREKVQSSALSADELVFLQELIKNHTVVYKWDSAGVFIRYALKSHSKKVADNDKLINTINVTLQPSIEHVPQKGE